MRAKVSVVIVTWNSQDEISACLESFDKFASKNYDYEIIVVDNKSSDSTVKVINKKRLAHCKVYALDENTGFSSGNNYGLKKCAGEYVLLLNPDTILTEDIIDAMVHKLAEPNTGIVGCKLLNDDLTLQQSAFNFETPLNLFIDNLRLPKVLPNFINEKAFPNYSRMEKSKQVDWLIGAVMLLRAKDLKKIGGLSEEYFMYTEDMDLCKKFDTELKMKTRYTADVSIIHLGGRSENKNYNYNKTERLLKNKEIFLRKFYGNKVALRGLLALRGSYLIKLYISKVILKFNASNSSNKLNVSMLSIYDYLKKRESLVRIHYEDINN